MAASHELIRSPLECSTSECHVSSLNGTTHCQVTIIQVHLYPSACCLRVIIFLILQLLIRTFGCRCIFRTFGTRNVSVSSKLKIFGETTLTRTAINNNRRNFSSFVHLATMTSLKTHSGYADVQKDSI